ncbi:MAG: transglycosylase SLT domain-containing protein [Rhizobiales bacterium]|nr:transglycosylase SLT domain-containing protein [Hyphomicrobiales bacterium]
MALLLCCMAPAMASGLVLPLERPGSTAAQATPVPAPVSAPIKTPVSTPSVTASNGVVPTGLLLSPGDLAATRDAFAEADRGNWVEAMRHMSAISDPAARKLILWSRFTSDDSSATLSDIVAFMEQNPDWPRQSTLALRAEQALLIYPLSDADTLNWFDKSKPQTGDGRLRYAHALLVSGRKDEAKAVIQQAWIENDFSAASQAAILREFRPYLTTDIHQARLARLLADRRASDAKTTAALIGQDAQALANARIELTSARSKDATQALSKVPDYLRRDPGLLFDQARYERRRGNPENAIPLLVTAPNKPHGTYTPDGWWVERSIAARKALASGLYNDAYKIAAGNGLSEGGDFAEAEFMAGWIALQYLNKPDIAFGHFDKLAKGVSTPISKARAEYWSARAKSAGGDKDKAKAHYTAAATYPTTFYGQLSLAALATMGGDGKMTLTQDPMLGKGDKKKFLDTELVRAARILNALDRENQTWVFMLHMANTLEDPAKLAALSDLAAGFGDAKLSLRIAKAASLRNIVLAQRAYPTSRMPQYTPRGASVEKALVYGLSRQESEFDAAAMSPAGARGLMQLMPTTARAVAKQVGLPYSKARLTDPTYNATLGSAHLGDLVDSFDGSYIMSIAAYNAGASRVNQWVAQYGDPRSTKVDAIDWMESIPFSETRNYVQRVMENLEVYRTRLSGKNEAVQINKDIKRHTGAPISTSAPLRMPVNVPLVASPAPKPTASTGTTEPSPAASVGTPMMAPVIEKGD